MHEQTRPFVSTAEKARARRVDLTTLITDTGVALTPKANGTRLVARCPFHRGDDRPSFMVTPAKNVWYCFGCQKGGDVISYVMHLHSLNFVSAVRWLGEQ